VRIERLVAPLGAEIHGFSAGATPGGDAVPLRNTLRGALREHGLLVVRSLTAGTDELQNIAAWFGEPRVVGGSAVVETSNFGPDGTIASPPAAGHGATPWIADGSFLADPPIAVLTLAVEAPTRGGQSQFADMRKALRLLPPEDRAEMTSLALVHVDPSDPASNVEHPWVKIGDDGVQHLYMGAHASHIAGRDVDDSRRWFDEIEAQLPVHDVYYEHRWLPGDLVIHDPRIVMQRTLGYDIANERRRLVGVVVTPPPEG